MAAAGSSRPPSCQPRDFPDLEHATSPTSTTTAASTSSTSTSPPERDDPPRQRQRDVPEPRQHRHRRVQPDRRLDGRRQRRREDRSGDLQLRQFDGRHPAGQRQRYFGRRTTFATGATPTRRNGRPHRRRRTGPGYRRTTAAGNSMSASTTPHDASDSNSWTRAANVLRTGEPANCLNGGLSSSRPRPPGPTTPG